MPARQSLPGEVVMTVEVRVPSVLRAATGGEKVVRGSGATLAALLADLDGGFPELRAQLFEGNGSFRRFLNVYVNDEDVRYTGRLETPLQSGDVVSILPAVAGGR
jgi:molybdopterin synthase sulfur carrier subunit